MFSDFRSVELILKCLIPQEINFIFKIDST